MCYCKVSVTALLTKAHKILVVLFLPLPLNVFTSLQAVGCLAFITLQAFWIFMSPGCPRSMCSRNLALSWYMDWRWGFVWQWMVQQLICCRLMRPQTEAKKKKKSMISHSVHSHGLLLLPASWRASHIIRKISVAEWSSRQWELHLWFGVSQWKPALPEKLCNKMTATSPTWRHAPSTLLCLLNT